MTAVIWFVVVGLLFIFMALSRSVLTRLPLTTAIVYLGAGILLDPGGFARASLDAVDSSALLEVLAEIAVLISLFAAGLKLRTPWRERRWTTPLRLATLSMTLTVAGVAAAGVWGLGLPLGAAVLLGAVLAPTDPVLASDVQVKDPHDRDRLRFDLTGEAGLNDGTAFPFVMLGLGLLGVHEIGAYGWRWVAVDLVWAVAAGLGVGWVLGMLVGRLVLYLRREHHEAVGLDEMVALGLIALAYGVALGVKSYGFLAVFAAAVSLRRLEEREGSADAPPPPREVMEMAAEGAREEIATDEASAPTYMVRTALGVTEQMEHIIEAALVLLLGGLLAWRYLTPDVLWFAPLLFLVIRPLAVLLGDFRRGEPPVRRALTAWFGIRGVGSIYYLMFALEHGVPRPLAERLTAIVLTTIAVSILVHGISVSPLTRWYARSGRQARDEDETRRREVREATA